MSMEQNLKEERLEKFRKAFEAFVDDPQVAGTADEFHSYEESYCGLWVSGESGNSLDGICVFQYGGNDHPKLEEFLDKWNAHYEWYDCGTVMIYLE